MYACDEDRFFVCPSQAFYWAVLHFPKPCSSSCMVPEHKTEPILGNKKAFSGMYHRLGNRGLDLHVPGNKFLNLSKPLLLHLVNWLKLAWESGRGDDCDRDRTACSCGPPCSRHSTTESHQLHKPRETAGGNVLHMTDHCITPNQKPVLCLCVCLSRGHRPTCLCHRALATSPCSILQLLVYPKIPSRQGQMSVSLVVPHVSLHLCPQARGTKAGRIQVWS